MLLRQCTPDLGRFVDRLRQVYQNELIAVILYGSAASGELGKKHQNINVLVVMRDTSIAALSRITAALQESAFRTIHPVFFTEAYIACSSDVFPIEFLDMQANYKVLYGKDVLAAISVETKHLRFQCEQELKSKLIALKTGYVRATSTAELRALLVRSCTSVVHIARSLIILNGTKPPYKKEEVIDEIARQFSIDAAVFKKILTIKNEARRVGGAELYSLVSAFAAVLETIVAKVDSVCVTRG